MHLLFNSYGTLQYRVLCATSMLQFGFVNNNMIAQQHGSLRGQHYVCYGVMGYGQFIASAHHNAVIQ